MEHIDAETEAKIKEHLLDSVAYLESKCKEATAEREDPSNVWDPSCDAQRPFAADSNFVAETPLVYQKEFFGFLLTVTKNSKGILLELHTCVRASAVFGLCCRFLTGLGVPAAQIGGVEAIFSEWLPFPTPER